MRDELGQELFGANVLVQGTTIGAVSDVEGEFTIERVPPGTYEVRFSLLGHMTKVVGGVAVAGGRTSRIEVVLEEEAIELTAVQIVGERSRQGMDDVRTSLKFLQPQTVRAVAGLGEDIIRGLQSLPGVVAPNDFTAQFAVRGSGPDQNLIVMDDIEIFN
ncbi:MAG: carboxypeptidase-like regulatory domain-containing protein, partial [Bacteroidetes bacterium]|nr:carboxypeptidase-like regulatory domain-containing protein [Bacteroidota bacterium]